jgi:hypothetical protein
MPKEQHMVENDDGGILSAEQVAEPRAAYPTPKTAAERAKERREAARQRKRDQRARDKAEKETQAAMSQAETIKDFWNESLKTADPAKLAEWEERQERVLDTLHWMESWVNGTYNVSPDDTLCYVGLEEGIADLEADVAKHGLTIIEVTLIPFWKPEEKDFFQRVVNRSGPTEVFIRYGIIVGIPEHRYGVFHEKFIQKPKALTSYASTLSCLCGATTSVSIETAREYARRQYRCQRCLDKEVVSRAAVAKALSVEYNRPENTIYDSWGRVKL